MLRDERLPLICGECGQTEPLMAWKENVYFGLQPAGWLAVPQPDKSHLCPRCWVRIDDYVFDRRGTIISTPEMISLWRRQRRMTGQVDDPAEFAVEARRAWNTWSRKAALAQ